MPVMALSHTINMADQMSLKMSFYCSYHTISNDVRVTYFISLIPGFQSITRQLKYLTKMTNSIVMSDKQCVYRYLQMSHLHA